MTPPQDRQGEWRKWSAIVYHTNIHLMWHTTPEPGCPVCRGDWRLDGYKLPVGDIPALHRHLVPPPIPRVDV